MTLYDASQLLALPIAALMIDDEYEPANDLDVLFDDEREEEWDTLVA